MIFISVGSMILTVLQIICCWKVFVKAGYEGWKCLIPIYNLVITARIAKLSGACALLLFIPFVGMLFSIVMKFRICKSFKMGTGLFILSLLFPIMAYFCIAFNPYAEYCFE